MRAVLVGVCAAVFCASGPLRAQEQLAVKDRQAANVPAWSELLATPVSVHLRNVSLPHALDALAANAKVFIQYSVRTLRPYDQRINLALKNVSLKDALDKVFVGTTLHAIPDGAMQLSIVDGVEQRRTQVVNGTIIGKIVNGKTKQPIVGAKVTVEGATVSAITGEDGTFRMTVSTGQQTLQIRAVGFVRQVKVVQVGDAQMAMVEVVLDPSASVLDAVVVTGTVVATERKAIPNPITVITADEIEKRGITRIEELLRGDIPGVVALDVGTLAWTENDNNNQGLGGLVTSQVYARGSSGLGRFGGTSTPLKTFIDGVELLDPSYLGTIDPRSVERIEVIVGPQAATIYGAGAMGGVMQIFTKKGAGMSSNDFTARLRYGLLESNLSNGRTPTHNHTATLSGGIGPAFSYSSTISYDYTGQWQPDLFSRRIGASAGVTSHRNPVTVSGSVSTTTSSNGTSNYPEGGMMGTIFRSSGIWTNSSRPSQSQRISKTSNQTVALTVDHRISHIWGHSLTIGRSQNIFRVVPMSPRWTTVSDTLFRHNESNGMRTNWSYNTSTSGSVASILSSSLTIGASGSWGDQTRITGCTATSKVTSMTECSSGIPVDVTKSIEDRSWGGFGNFRLGFFDQLYVTFGLRAERNPNYGADHKIDWTPTNGLAYAVEFGNVTMKALASYGRATRTPPADAREELFFVDPWSEPAIRLVRKANPLLRPEYSRGPQGGIELYFGNRGSLAVNHYNQTITDLLQSIVVDSSPYFFISDPSTTAWDYIAQWVNVGKVRQFGWEASGSLNLAFLSFQGTYSWSDSRVLAVNQTRMAGLWGGESPPSPGASSVGVLTHTGNFRMTYALRGTSASISTSVIGKSLSYGVLHQGDMSWYHDALFARLRMYLNYRSRGPEDRVFSKPGYTKTNLNVSQRLNAWASVTIDIDNAGNTFDADGAEAMRFNPTLGRQTRIGVSLRSSR